MTAPHLPTGSVEGLALPFLFNWLCGDVTNLVGCLLTDQLPFQVGAYGRNTEAVSAPPSLPSSAEQMRYTLHIVHATGNRPFCRPTSLHTSHSSISPSWGSTSTTRGERQSASAAGSRDPT